MIDIEHNQEVTGEYRVIDGGGGHFYPDDLVDCYKVGDDPSVATVRFSASFIDEEKHKRTT